jgi:hypothetical protein
VARLLGSRTGACAAAWQRTCPPAAARTGECVSTSTSHGAIDGYEAVHVPGPAAAARAETAMFRRRSAQPSRRAVLHVQAPGDPAAPSDLASWFTERAFHFYVAGLRLPGNAALSARQASRDLRPALADLDTACAHLRQVDGMTNVIVTAQGRAAVAVALWTDSRDGDQGPDALILRAPAWSGRSSRHLTIACPVLVLGEADAATTATRNWPLRHRGRGAPVTQLGGHVTWLALSDAGERPMAADGGRPGYFDELGRWLGAYMYGQVRDQLL